MRLVRHGFYPAGGGRVEVEIEPAGRLAPLELLERGAIHGRRLRAISAKLPPVIVEREARSLQDRLRWSPDDVETDAEVDSPGPGNVMMAEIEAEHVTEVFTGFGQRRATSRGRAALF